jgi:hypothetical protein
LSMIARLEKADRHALSPFGRGEILYFHTWSIYDC